MPLPFTFDWSEDETKLYFVLQLRGVKAKNVGVSLGDVYVKVNHHPSLFEADLRHEIDSEHPQTRCRVGSDKISLTLHKKEPGLWNEFRAEGSKAELRERRQRALAAAEEREKERLKKRSEFKEEMLKAGEQEQWRLDRENRERIEKWEQEEKEKWEKEVYDALEEENLKAAGPAPLPKCSLDDLDAEEEPEPPKRPNEPPVPAAAPAFAPPPRSAKEQVVEVTDEEAEEIRAQKAQPIVPADQGAIWTSKELEDLEEYVPPVRDNPGKIGVRFSERPRPGVPVRDRGPRPPPMPKVGVKSDLPPMIAGDEAEDENDPVWLKDKSDKLMVIGDYQGAHNGYTQALKIGTNAKCFANRAVANLYLGQIQPCIEDCNSALRILDLRNKTRDGQMPTSADPEDQRVRARVELRLGVAYLWLGAFGKAEQHFTKALDNEEGLELEERRQVKEDLARVQAAKTALLVKERADSATKRIAAVMATGTKSADVEGPEAVLGLYDEADKAAGYGESAVVLANRCYAKLCAGKHQECLEDAEAALDCLRRWPAARKPPKAPPRPSRLEPPVLDDPTFVHPDQQKQGEVDWLMKHNGGSKTDLPALPPEYEWVKDIAEKNENAWIAIKRKMPKATIDAIRKATAQLQDAMYSRKPALIRQQMEISLEQNRAGEGPSHRAIRQAEEYAEKLEEHDKQREEERAKEAAEARQEVEECNLEEELGAVRTGVASTGFGRTHFVQQTRRRLFVKIMLRRARAHELLGSLEAALADVRSVLRVEPTHQEAKERAQALEQLKAGSAPS